MNCRQCMCVRLREWRSCRFSDCTRDRCIVLGMDGCSAGVGGLKQGFFSLHENCESKGGWKTGTWSF